MTQTFTTATWANSGPPPISKANLDRFEAGIYNAHMGATTWGEHIRWATPQHFAGIDPTGATSSRSAFLNFFNAIPEGGLGIIPPGTYMLDSTVLTIAWNKRAKIEASPGALFVVTAAGTSGSGFNFVGSFGTTYNVVGTPTSSLALDEYGNNGEDMWVTTITTSAATGWKKYDLIKMVSDDLDVAHDPTTGIRSSQTFRVINVKNSTTVVLAGEMRCPFTTNVRVAKWSDGRLFWEGGQFMATDALMAGSTMHNGGPLMVSHLAFPVVKDVEMIQTAGPAFTITRCYKASNLNCRVRWALDGSSTQTNIFFGYGINDGGSEYSYVEDFFASRVRHAFTTNGSGVSAGSSISQYGRSYGAIVSNSVCHGATQTSWDTHENGEQIEFRNCLSQESYAAFSLRGINNRITNGHIIGRHRAGIVTMWSYGGANSYGNIVKGLLIDGARPDIGAMVQSNGLSTASPIETRPNYAVDVTVINRDPSDYVLGATYGTLLFDNIRYDGGGTNIKNVGTSGTISAMSRVA